MGTWLIIAAMAAVTYVLRAVPMLVEWRADHPLVERALRYVAPAILAALVVPDVLAHGGRVDGGPRLWAGVAAAVVAWRTRNTALTIVVGMAVFAGLRWRFGQ